jgi:hypothetical protein
MSTMGPLCLEQLTQDETLEEVCVGPIPNIAEASRRDTSLQNQLDAILLFLTANTMDSDDLDEPVEYRRSFAP